MTDPVSGWGKVVWHPGGYERGFRWAGCSLGLVVWGDRLPPTPVFVEDVQLRGRKWPDVGQVLPMRIDRAAPERFEIDWDQVPDLRDRVLALCAQVAEQMRT